MVLRFDSKQQTDHRCILGPTVLLFDNEVECGAWEISEWEFEMSQPENIIE